MDIWCHDENCVLAENYCIPLDFVKAKLRGSRPLEQEPHTACEYRKETFTRYGAQCLLAVFMNSRIDRMDG
jgi:hypothetical protein